MEYTNNGLGRMIRDTIRMTGIIVFGAWQEKYKQPKFIENGAQEHLYQHLLNLIDEGKLGEAENKLIEQIELLGESDSREHNLRILEMALCVYGYMNEKEDDFLDMHDFSRNEIREGLDMVIQTFGIMQ